MNTPRALMVVEAEYRVYRRTWRGTVLTTWLRPILFLVAMGMGLGALIDRNVNQALGEAGYLAFLAPGLMAASAMQTAITEASWPVRTGIKWRKNYWAQISTPLTTNDLLTGLMIWITIRLLFVSTAFAVVIWVFGAGSFGKALMAVPAATLTGMAFASPLAAFAAWVKEDSTMIAMFRFSIIPLFLFSGAFFPIEQLPDFLEPIVVLSPAWHGVDLCRWIILGTPLTLSIWTELGYLAATMAAGWWAAARQLRKRLIV
ncbi:MAG: ABC transporter permease [Actinomycetia bacterium]|nr:ABC transporter permease [Actinomycetes bacterium]